MPDGLDMLLRLALAAALGGVIGIDRERRDWAAGLRTHMLVSVGAALAMLVSAFGFGDILGTPKVILDPSRIAAQVVSGIGFLGAGTILFMQREQVVRGLTTAAGLWVVAAIGLAAGSGMYLAAALATALVWVIMAVLKPLERRLFARRGGRYPSVTLRVRGDQVLSAVESLVQRRQLPLFKLVLHGRRGGVDELALLFERDTDGAALCGWVDALRHADGIEIERVDVEPLLAEQR